MSKCEYGANFVNSLLNESQETGFKFDGGKLTNFTSGSISPNLMVVIQNVDVDLRRLMLNDALHIFHSQAV